MARRASLAFLVTAALMVSAPPASAACQFDGSVPGTSSKAYTVLTPAGTLYIDDRDLADLDDDGQSNGVFVYLESNGQIGLQRDDRQAAFDHLPGGNLPFVYHFNPMPVGPVTLFPNGYTLGGESLSTTAGQTDPCGSNGGDTLLYRLNAVLY